MGSFQKAIGYRGQISRTCFWELHASDVVRILRYAGDDHVLQKPQETLTRIIAEAGLDPAGCLFLVFDHDAGWCELLHDRGRFVGFRERGARWEAAVWRSRERALDTIRTEAGRGRWRAEA